MSFQIHALPAAQFAPLFSCPDEQLAEARATRVVVDASPGYPCRVSLADAEVGETVLLINYEHLPGSSPYRAAHAIYVRERAEQAFPEVGAVPEVLARRLLSVRAFDSEHHMIDADVVDGSQLADAMTAVLRSPKVRYLHLHNAKPGCFAARVTRA